MFYSATSIILIVFAGIIALAAFWTVFRKSWFITWLKATFAFSFVALALLLVLIGIDLNRYQSYRYDVPVAKLKIKRQDQQRYLVYLDIVNGGSYEYILSGDLWQLDARLITWNGPLATFVGATPGYRLDRISGRYLSLDQEVESERTVYPIVESLSPFDLFQWLQSEQAIPWIDAKYGSATYLPLKDGAEFAVAVGLDGLVTRPVNTAAVEAVESWK